MHLWKIENYYQESGRAGRDGRPASCILLFRPGDVQRLTSLAAENTNQRRNIALVYEILLCVDPAGDTACRRKALAKYFGDTWQSTDCLEACDVCYNNACKSPKQASNRDVSVLAHALLRLLATALSHEGGDKLTLLKASEVARKDTAIARRLRGGLEANEACRRL